MMPSSARFWLRVTLFNLLLVAVLGTTLRYKIAFSLRFIDQKNFMHGHSHFAFAGWISMTLMIMMIHYLSKNNEAAVFKRYRWILWANLITAYGMLICLPIEGYKGFSILFSTLSIFSNYAFAIFLWRDLSRSKEKTPAQLWFKASLIFNAVSSIGPYWLAWMMATKHFSQEQYLASIYFFLHFQYNGWFFFACMGLLTARILLPIMPVVVLKKIFWLFALACVPAYFLSALWLPIPFIVYLLVIVAAAAQLFAWIWLVFLMMKRSDWIKNNFSAFARKILLLSAIALTIKLLLQLGSTIPSLSTLAYGFRPIVIGYLHLVLLGIISLFLLAFIYGYEYVKTNATMRCGIIIFTIAVIVNELLLMLQGAAGLDYVSVPHINEYLFVAACLLLTGIGIMNISQRKKTETA